MFKFLFSTILFLPALSLFAQEKLYISRDQFGKPQEFASRYHDGSLLLTINKASVKELGKGKIEGAIEYTVTNQLKGDIDRFELDFELKAKDRQEIIDMDERRHGRLAKGESKTFTVKRSEREKRRRPGTEIESIKVEIDNVYLSDDRKEIKF